ncbi:MAG: hypothetical protein AAFY73_06350 [Pseudomonadota bacterium]
MKYVGLILLMGGFIAIGVLRIVLPATTGSEIANFDVSFDPLEPTTVNFQLTPEDAPVHILLEELYFADSNLHYTGLTANRHAVGLSGPRLPLDDYEATIKPSHWADDSSLDAGRPYIAKTSVTILHEPAEGTYIATVYGDQDRDLETRALRLIVRANAFTPHRHAELAAFASVFAGIAVLIMTMVRWGGRRKAIGNSEPRRPRFGRRGR